MYQRYVMFWYLYFSGFIMASTIKLILLFIIINLKRQTVFPYINGTVTLFMGDVLNNKKHFYFIIWIKPVKPVTYE